MNLLSRLRGRCLFPKGNYSYPLRNPCRNFSKRPPREDVGMNLAPKIKSEDTHGSRTLPVVLKCFIFTSGFCCTVFVGSSIWHYENVKKSFEKQDLSEWINSSWDKLEGFEHKEEDFSKIMDRYLNASLLDCGKIFWSICAMNVLVFFCWRYPPLQSIIVNYFCSSPTARAVCWPMFLSTFSHYAPLHLFMNMYALNNLSIVTCTILGPEQFLGFYLAGGVVSSFTSNIFKLLRRTGRPSVGASGAIMALLGYYCTKYPDAKLGMVLIPNMSFSADAAFKAVMFIDISGIILRWKLFDHAAHLGGALFGIFYALIGQSLIWGNRSYVNKAWEDISSKYTDKKK